MPYYKSVFISDLHLGSPWCQARELTGFLTAIQCDRLYLVGDVFDGCRPLRGGKLPRDQVAVLQMLQALSQKIEIIYVTGNHDSFMRGKHRLRTLFEQALPSVQICDATAHLADDGRRYLVIHGDIYDPALRVPLLARIGAWFYRTLRSLADVTLSQTLGLASETMEAALMRWQDAITRLMGDPEARMMEDAARLEYDGVICGHTHLAVLRRSRGLVYANCGYWSGPAHALVEQPGGTLALLPWSESWASAASAASPASLPRPQRA